MTEVWISPKTKTQKKILSAYGRNLYDKKMRIGNRVYYRKYDDLSSKEALSRSRYFRQKGWRSRVRRR